jgi:hypothetical protein
MLALAVGQRLGQYGLTEQRYLLVLMAAWAAILVVSQAERWRDIRWISGGLGALLVLASLGPWGAFGLPVRWQAEQIRSRLAAAGLLEAGRLARDADAIALPDAERSRVVAATDYLLKQKRLAVLAPIFEGARDDPFAGGKTSDQTRLRAAINTRLGIPETLGGAARVVYRHTARAPWSIPLAGGESLIGPFDIYGGKGTISTLDKAWTADLAGDVLIVTRESDARQARFALDADAGLRAALSVTPQDGEKARPVRVTRVSGDAPVDIWVIMALRQNGLDKPTNGLSFFVLLAAEKP